MHCFNSPHLRLLICGGVRFDDVERAFAVVWSILHKFVVLLSGYFLLGSFLLIIFNIYDFGFFMAGFIGVAFNLQPLFVEVLSYKNKNQLTGLFQQYVKIVDVAKSDSYDLQYNCKTEFLKHTSAIKWRLSILTVLVCIFISSFIISNLLSGSTELPCVVWNPIDTTVRPAYVFLCIVQFLTLIGTFLMYAAQEGVLTTFMRLQLIHGRYLYADLSNIHNLVATQHSKAFQDLRWWIAHHQIYLSNETKLQEIFSPILLINYCVTFSFVFSSAVSTVTPIFELPQITTLCAFSFMYLLALYRLCSLSEALREMNQELFEGCLSTQGILNGKRMAKAMLLIQTRCSNTNTLSAYGQYPLTKESFGLLLKATFSYIVTTMQIHNAHNEL